MRRCVVCTNLDNAGHDSGLKQVRHESSSMTAIFEEEEEEEER
jgi:hypothetical protein